MSIAARKTGQGGNSHMPRRFPWRPQEAQLSGPEGRGGTDRHRRGIPLINLGRTIPRTGWLLCSATISTDSTSLKFWSTFWTDLRTDLLLSPRDAQSHIARRSTMAAGSGFHPRMVSGPPYQSFDAPAAISRAFLGYAIPDNAE
jgi:hypothetical protein